MELEVSAPVGRADVRESEKVERLGFTLASMRPAFGCIATELDQARLVGVKLETERSETSAQLSESRVRVCFVLEPDDEVVRVANDDHLAVRLAASPLPDPQ